MVLGSYYLTYEKYPEHTAEETYDDVAAVKAALEEVGFDGVLCVELIPYGLRLPVKGHRVGIPPPQLHKLLVQLVKPRLLRCQVVVLFLAGRA